MTIFPKRPVRILYSPFLRIWLVTGLMTAPLAAVGQDGTAEQNPPQHETLLQGAKSIPGLIPLFLKGDKLYAELSSRHFENEFLVLISIARGIGQGNLLGGMTWGDDWVWSFRRVGERVFIQRQNVRFRAQDGTPAATAIKIAYGDSVLFSLPVLCVGPHGGSLVELNSVFMTDLPQISKSLPGFFLSTEKSTWSAIKGFEGNTEIQVAATYASGGNREIESVPDSRGVTLHVHYSISMIPQNGYRPRLADDRVGYFLTVVKDFSQGSEATDRFVRYINRWNLRKSEPSQNVSAPKKPIIFWLENTIPHAYRKTVREGIEEWNKALEKAGYAHAIEVRQQPDDADWDPEDINYNTFRWITSGAGFAMGPSRVNPYTGEILDADILFDADFLQVWRDEFETFTPQSIAALTNGSLGLRTHDLTTMSGEANNYGDGRLCLRGEQMARQMALARTAQVIHQSHSRSGLTAEALTHQALKATVMHEVGHTLGLRHNFKGSTWLSLEEMNDVQQAATRGMLASVMDYDAANIVPLGETQGLYYTPTIGPYDYFAIEYGYREFEGSESEELAKIAARGGQPGLAYATDEDTRGIDSDPYANRWDLGQDGLQFAERQARLVQQLLPHVVERMIDQGEDYSQARRAFGVLISTHGQAMYFVSRFVGGIVLERRHKGDLPEQAPFQIVPASTQRRALEVLHKHLFQEFPGQVPPELYSYLVPSLWSHWGTSLPGRKDFPIHDVILMWQSRILDQLLSPTTLSRLHDAELKLPAEQDTLTAAELIQNLTEGIFLELSELPDEEFTNRRPAISSLRRNLQRTLIQLLGRIALGDSSAPEDCRTVSCHVLEGLHRKLVQTLTKLRKLDTYTEAHLRESANRIKKILDAAIVRPVP